MDEESTLSRMEDFAAAYRTWLMEDMGAVDYGILFDILYDVEFTWTIPMDEDRARCGQELRARFEYESGMTCEQAWLEWPCSFLEMLIGLAYSIENRVLYDGLAGDRTQRWFWEMLEGLGLDICDDFWMMTEPDSTAYVVERAERVVRREYSEDGSGGIFQLGKGHGDVRKMAVWEQACAYISDHKIR